MNNRFVSYLAGAVLCVFLAGGIAQAASFTYSEQRKQIKAGVVVLSNAPLPSSTFVNPYVFHIMNQRQDLKPSGWDFYNPLAPTHVTEGIVNRWGAPYTLRQAVHKDMGCYWEVFVGLATPDDIAQFDVLLIPGAGVLEFTAGEREKLRKFVDNGGVLWIDNYKGGAQFNAAERRFFIRDLQFAGGVAGPVSVQDLAKAHSLLNRPFLLAWTDINRLGGRLRPEDPARTLSGGAGGGKPDERYFISILAAKDGPVASVANYGSGHIVVVAEGISAAIADPVGVSSSGRGFCGGNFVLAEAEDLKFAYNIVSLGSQYATFQKAPRRPGYSFAEIGAPLSTLWEYRAPEVKSTASSPAILDDMLFYVDGAGMLHAFEMVPSKDRNGDGEPDDGVDDPEGAPYDELWSVPLGGRASSPTAAYVPIGGKMTPVVFVALASGQVVAINAVTGNVIGDVFSMGTTPFPAGMDVPAPAYVDGTVYLGDGVGRLHAKNYLASDPAESEWANPGTVTSQCPAHSPTAGYYYDPTTGATELVVYLAKRGNGLPGGYGELCCYSVAAFNERLKAESLSQPSLLKTRSGHSTSILSDPKTWDLYYVDPNLGLQLVPDDKVTLNPSGQPGFFQINDEDYFENVINGAPVIADYHLDYDDINARPRRRLNVLHATAPALDYTGFACAPATSRKDILYFAAENGSLYAVKDRGYAEDLICKWRWHLKDDRALSALGLSDPRPVGSPAVAGDMVYFAVNEGDKGQGFILAFKADPVFSVHLPEQAEPGTVRVKQYDTMNPSVDPFDLGGGAAQDDVRPNATYIVDYDSGKVTILNFQGGGHYLSAAQDLILEYKPVGSDTIQTALIEAFNPAPGDKWNNLVWFVKLPRAVTSSSVVMGDILYVGCEDGRLVSMDVVKIGRGKTGPAERIKWEAVAPPPPGKPMAWAEPVMGVGNPILAAVAGSHGMLAVATAEGVTVLHNPVTLIADGDRLVEMDAGGRVAWSCDSTVELAYTTTGAGAAAMPVLGLVKVPFNRPAVARRAPSGGIVVADTGNNRVVYIDGGGNVLWQITTFEDPEPNQLLPAGSPLSLNRPKDVSMWAVNEPVDPSDLSKPSFPAYHYLIADSGNYRVLEVVARRDPNTGLYRNELDWTTKTLAEGKKYEYASARSIYGPATSGPALVCVVTNEVSDAQGVCPGGALIKITGIGTSDEAYTVCRGDDPGLAVGPARPVFFTRYYTSNTEYTDVALETDAVHVVVYTVDPATGTATPNVRPPFTAGDYRNAPLDPVDPEPCGLPLAAAYAQVLPNGNVLVTNRATVGSGLFKGEIFELRFDGVQWWIVDNSRIGAATPNSHGLRQPSSAERQLNR